MTAKAAFNAEEWSQLATAPALAGMRVAAAARGGALRESVALQRSYARAREQHRDGLLHELLHTPPALDLGSVPRTGEDLRQATIDALRRAVRILERVGTDDEVVAYKRFVYAVAEDVAHAHREGGFLGVGGTEVSEPEQAALDEIAAVFDEPRSV